MAELQRGKILRIKPHILELEEFLLSPDGEEGFLAPPAIVSGNVRGTGVTRHWLDNRWIEFCREAFSRRVTVARYLTPAGRWRIKHCPGLSDFEAFVLCESSDARVVDLSYDLLEEATQRHLGDTSRFQYVVALFYPLCIKEGLV